MSKSTLTSYVNGFLASVALTLAAYFVVLRPGFFGLGGTGVIAVILALAVIQFFVQITLFLHLWRESGPRWNLVVFLSTLGIVLIVVIGSIWIMAHLNYNMMASPDQMEQYIQSQDGI